MHSNETKKTAKSEFAVNLDQRSFSLGQVLCDTIRRFCGSPEKHQVDNPENSVVFLVICCVE